MVRIQMGFTHEPRAGQLDEMFEDRKRVFVDLLRWDVAVVDGRLEIDQFDNEFAVYLLVEDSQGTHLGSARLLPTDRDHILKTIFPHLCAGSIPEGPRVREITRFCLSPRLTARERMQVRKQLVTALAQYALHAQIATYTGVAERAWFDQIAQFGWHCGALAPLTPEGSRALVGLRIDINPSTIQGLARARMYADIALQGLEPQLAA